MHNHELIIEGVSKKVRTSDYILTDVSLSFGTGIFGLLGPNGSGKTTLLRILATLIRQTEGRVSFDGMDSLENREQFRKHLGYLPQKFGMYPHLTAQETLLFLATLKGISKAAAREETAKLLDMVGLADVEDVPVGDFSGGMVQRVGIAGTLLGSPDLIVVDEPTTGLDPEERLRFREILARAAQESTIVLSTHILQDVELGCTELGILSRGKLVANMPPDEFKQQVQGAVWEIETPIENLPEIKSMRSIVSVRDTSKSECTVRFVGSALGWGEHAENPRVEDSYVYLVNQSREDGSAW